MLYLIGFLFKNLDFGYGFWMVNIIIISFFLKIYWVKYVDVIKEDLGKIDFVLFLGIYIVGRFCDYMSDSNEIFYVYNI